MTQTSFQLYSDKWAVGQIADNSINQIDSFIASTIIHFGSAVMRTVVDNVKSEKKVSAFSGTTAGTCIGFAVRREMELTGQYEIGDQIDVLRIGRIITIVKDSFNIKADDLAYLYADGAIGNTTNDAHILIGRFITNHKIENININGVLTPSKLVELQIDMLTNA